MLSSAILGFLLPLPSFAFLLPLPSFALAVLLQVSGPAGTYTVHIPGPPVITQTPTSVTFTWDPAGFEPWQAPQIAHLPDGSRMINFGRGWEVLPDSGYIP